jgi:hypothetical protein
VPHEVRTSPLSRRKSRFLSLVLVAGLVSVYLVDTSPPSAFAQATPPTDPVCVYTPTDFAYAFLTEISEPKTPSNIEAILAWEMAEGGNWENTAHYNPLNTTWVYDGSTDFEPNPPAPVQSYRNWDDGVYATALTITDDFHYPDANTLAFGYDQIMSALAAGNNAKNVTDAVDSSDWGTTNASSFVGDTYDPPAPSWDSPCVGAPSVLVESPENTLVDYWQGAAGAWTDAAITGPGSVYSTPAVAVSHSGAAIVAAEGPRNSLRVFWTGGTTWYGPVGIGADGSTDSAPSVAVNSGGLATVAVQGPDDRLWVFWQASNGQWHGPLGVGGPGANYSRPSVAMSSAGLPIVAVQGPGDRLGVFWEASNGQWHGPVGVGGPGSAYSSPSVAVNPEGLPTVAVQGPGDRLWLFWEASNGLWHGPLGAGGPNANAATPSIGINPSG